ncbi:hypothetical protein LINPERPRIM_LOCUS25304 [Linum perenne]
MISRNIIGCHGKECVFEKKKEASNIKTLKPLIRSCLQDMLGEFWRILTPSLLAS